MNFICESLGLLSATIIGVLLIGTSLSATVQSRFGKKIILLLLGHRIWLRKQPLTRTPALQLCVFA